MKGDSTQKKGARAEKGARAVKGAREVIQKGAMRKDTEAARRSSRAARVQKGRAGRAGSGTERRLAGIRAAAGELGKALDAMEKARESVEGHFGKTAAANLARARGALEALEKAAGAGPLLDVRRLERDLASLVEACGELRTRKGKGRKRDILAVDDILGDAARRLELAVAGAAAGNLKLLTERLVDMESMRQELQRTVNERFRSRLEQCRKVLGALEGAAARLPSRGLDSVARELEGAVALSRACHPGKLGGKADDLYLIDGFVKQAARRLDKVGAMLAVRTEDSDG